MRKSAAQQEQKISALFMQRSLFRQKLEGETIRPIARTLASERESVRKCCWRIITLENCIVLIFECRPYHIRREVGRCSIFGKSKSYCSSGHPEVATLFRCSRRRYPPTWHPMLFRWDIDPSHCNTVRAPSVLREDQRDGARRGPAFASAQDR